MSLLKELRRRFERFCFRNRHWGIPNLMLYVSLGAGIVYLMSEMANNYVLYNILVFNRTKILQGQVWRLFTYPLTFNAGNLLYTLIGLVCYYSLGRAMENLWGTLRFNLFYFSGILMMDTFCMIFGNQATVSSLNLSLFLAYATLYPNTHFLLMFIIPVKAWIFALVYLVLILSDVIYLSYPVMYFPYNLYPLISLANYFLFFGKDVLNVIPLSWRANCRRLFRKKNRTNPQPKSKTIPFPNAGSYQATVATPKAPYTHRCTVCGRTDLSDPDLEFRYCSRCQGYHCYCIDHISNHTHL